VQLPEVVDARHSIRSYRADPLEPGMLDRILGAVNRAPSAGNLQAYEVYVVTGSAIKTAITHAALGQGFLEQAPVLLVFCANSARATPRYGRRGADLYAVQDATIACTFAMLAATDLGLGTVWVGAFDEEAVRRAIGAPDGHRPVAVLPVGYADEEPRETSRRPLESLVHRT
jgi:nitroreductase